MNTRKPFEKKSNNTYQQDYKKLLWESAIAACANSKITPSRLSKNHTSTQSNPNNNCFNVNSSYKDKHAKAFDHNVSSISHYPYNNRNSADITSSFKNYNYDDGMIPVPRKKKSSLATEGSAPYGNTTEYLHQAARDAHSKSRKQKNNIFGDNNNQNNCYADSYVIPKRRKSTHAKIMGHHEAPSKHSSKENKHHRIVDEYEPRRKLSTMHCETVNLNCNFSHNNSNIVLISKSDLDKEMLNMKQKKHQSKSHLESEKTKKHSIDQDVDTTNNKIQKIKKRPVSSNVVTFIQESIPARKGSSKSRNHNQQPIQKSQRSKKNSLVVSSSISQEQPNLRKLSSNSCSFTQDLGNIHQHLTCNLSQQKLLDDIQVLEKNLLALKSQKEKILEYQKMKEIAKAQEEELQRLRQMEEELARQRSST